LRVRLLISSARITLALAILGVMLLGDPPIIVRGVLNPQQGQALLSPPLAPADPSSLSLAGDCTPTPVSSPLYPPATSAPTWITAPEIHLDAPVVEITWLPVETNGVEVTEWQVPDSAAGFLKGTAYPGTPGNTVLAGHHNMGSEVFRYLIDLQIGDEITLFVDKTPYRYRVTQKEIVREQGASDEQRRENARWIGPTNDERLTLITCWPYTGNSHRLIVVARPAP